MIDDELISMVMLLGDSDRDVRKAVDERLLERCPVVIDDLRRLQNCSVILSRDQKKDIAGSIGRLGRESAFRELTSLKPEPDPSLPDTFFLLSRIVMPSLDRDEFFRQVNDLGWEVLSEINERQTAPEQVEIFNHVFFQRLRFSAGSSFPTSGMHYFMPSMLHHRTGPPVGIMLIYFLLARAAGIGIHPMCVEGGLAPVMVENGRNLFFIDLNNGGRIVDEASFYAGIYRTFRGHFEVMPGNDSIFPLIYSQTLLAFCSDSASSPYLEKAVELFRKTFSRS